MRGERFDCFMVPFGFKCIVPGVFLLLFFFWGVGGMGEGLTLETVKLHSHISK